MVRQRLRQQNLQKEHVAEEAVAVKKPYQQLHLKHCYPHLMLKQQHLQHKQPKRKLQNNEAIPTIQKARSFFGFAFFVVSFSSTNILQTCSKLCNNIFKSYTFFAN